MSAAPQEFIAVLMTASHREEAGQLAEVLVKMGLAACVQILPAMESVYRWQGKIQRQREVLLIAKTTRSRFAELEKEVRARHSYETPEIIAITLTAGSAAYLEWIESSVAVESEVGNS